MTGSRLDPIPDLCIFATGEVCKSMHSKQTQLTIHTNIDCVVADSSHTEADFASFGLNAQACVEILTKHEEVLPQLQIMATTLGYQKYQPITGTTFHNVSKLSG